MRFTIPNHRRARDSHPVLNRLYSKITTTRIAITPIATEMSTISPPPVVGRDVVVSVVTIAEVVDDVEDVEDVERVLVVSDVDSSNLRMKS